MASFEKPPKSTPATNTCGERRFFGIFPYSLIFLLPGDVIILFFITCWPSLSQVMLGWGEPRASHLLIYSLVCWLRFYLICICALSVFPCITISTHRLVWSHLSVAGRSRATIITIIIIIIIVIIVIVIITIITIIITSVWLADHAPPGHQLGAREGPGENTDLGVGFCCW